MTDLPTEPPTPPPGMRRLELRADEVNYLTRYWETPDHAQIFAWATKLLHDLTKLDEAGWRLTLSKADVNETTKQVDYSPDYRQVVFLMKWLAPTRENFARLPAPDVLDRMMKGPTP